MEKEGNYFYYQNKSLPSNFLVTDKKNYLLINGYTKDKSIYYNGWHDKKFLDESYEFIYFINDGLYQDIYVNYSGKKELLTPIDNLRYIGIIPEKTKNYYYSYLSNSVKKTTSDLAFDINNPEYFDASLHPHNSYQAKDYHTDDENVNRIFCLADENWETCYYYVWNNSGEETPWPGKPTTKISDYIYYVDVNKVYDNIIFNSGPRNTKQTNDLKISDALNYDLPLYDVSSEGFKELSFKNLSSDFTDIYFKKPSFLTTPYVYFDNSKYLMENLKDDIYHTTIPNNISEVAFGDDIYYTPYYPFSTIYPFFDGYSFGDFEEPKKEPFKNDAIKYYNDLFNPENKIEFSINMSHTELLKLQHDYEKFSSMGSKSPIYRMCDLTIKINNETFFFDQVGIRMKGNTSRTSFYDDNGFYNLIHFKLSFDETFDDVDEYEEPLVWTDKTLRKERKKRTFGLMKSLELKWNKNYDGTHIKTSYASNMFSEFGLYSQKVTLTKVKITNKGHYENLGIFDLIEPVDSNFLEKRLGENDLGGDLYKVGWTTTGGTLTADTLNSIGVEDELKGKFFIYDLKTNKKTSDHHNLKNLINGLNSDANIEELVDIDYFLKFMALSYITGNPDDFRNNYNNCYIYFLKSNSKAIFIPYDLDRTFGITKDYNPSGDAMTSINPYTKNTVSGNQVNPLILKTVCYDANQTYLLKYTNYLKEFINSDYLSTTNFNSLFNQKADLYKNDYLPTINKIKGKCINFTLTDSNMSFDEYIGKIKQIINNL